MKLKAIPLRCPCKAQFFDPVHSYTEPPPGEIRFNFSSSTAYKREMQCCRLCNHYVSLHEMDTSNLYSGEYVNSTYGENGIRKAFDKINNLDPKKSDNIGRVSRIVQFAKGHWPDYDAARRKLSILDVGSGLCVFLYRMKQVGWDCTALDPDQRAVNHAIETVGIQGVCGNFMEISDLGSFDAISFNKILEHVEDPVEFLLKAADHLRPGGFIYVELPDGEMASQEGYHREEFFIDHLHIFSLASLGFLASRSGLVLKEVERLREPSTKYTFRAFLVKEESLVPKTNGSV